MKTKYKHIYFEQGGQLYSKVNWLCRNKKTDDLLGEIEFYDQWNKWTFSGSMNSVFDTSCLKDIINFMEQLK